MDWARVSLKGHVVMGIIMSIYRSGWSGTTDIYMNVKSNSSVRTLSSLFKTTHFYLNMQFKTQTQLIQT